MKRAFLFAVTLFSALGVTAGVLWHQNLLQPWLRAQIVRMYVRRVAPSLPFQIESVDVDGEWRDFLSGHISSLSVTLRWGKWRFRLAGPIQITRPSHREEILATYSPQLILEPIKAGSIPSPALNLVLSIETNRSLTQLEGLGIELNTQRMSWPIFGLNAKQLKGTLHWGHWDLSPHHPHSATDTDEDDHLAQLNISLSEGSWTPDPNHGVHVHHLVLTSRTQATLPFQKQNLVLGPDVGFHLECAELETLIGDTYLDVPLSQLPLDGHATLQAHADHPPEPSNLNATLGHGKVDVSLTILRKDDVPTGATLKISSIPLDLSQLLRSTVNASQNSGGSLGLVTSRLKLFTASRGHLEVHSTSELGFPLQLKKISGTLQLKDLWAKWPAQGLAAQGLNLKAQLMDQKRMDGTLSIERATFHRFAAQLGPTHLKAVSGPLPVSYEVQAFAEKGPATSFPLTIEGVPLRLGALSGHVNLAPGDSGDSPFRLKTSAELSPMQTTALIHGFCLERFKIPPSQLQAHFTEIEMTPTSIDPTGTLEAQLFNGKIEIGDLGFFDLNTVVPELDFDATFSGIELSSLGDWSGFGEIDGKLEGHAHDVTVQGWLPTQYDFMYQIRPSRHNVVIFTPEALKNFIRLVGGPGVDSIPGIVDWIYFGLPAHLFYGYNVFYTGISVASKDGSIQIQTIEDQIDRSLRRRAEESSGEKHYILLGPRISIPLNAITYPVTVGAPAMSNFVKRAIETLAHLGDSKNKPVSSLSALGAHPMEKSDETQPPCLPLAD